MITSTAVVVKVGKPVVSGVFSNYSLLSIACSFVFFRVGAKETNKGGITCQDYSSVSTILKVIKDDPRIVTRIVIRRMTTTSPQIRPTHSLELSHRSRLDP